MFAKSFGAKRFQPLRVTVEEGLNVWPDLQPERIDQLHQYRGTGCLIDGEMKCSIRLNHFRLVEPLDRPHQPPVLAVQCVQLFRGNALSGERRSLGFDEASSLDQVLKFFASQQRNSKGTGAAHLERSLRHESMNGFTDRHRTGAEVAGKLAYGDRLARREVTTNQGGLDLIVSARLQSRGLQSSESWSQTASSQLAAVRYIIPAGARMLMRALRATWLP